MTRFLTLLAVLFFVFCSSPAFSQKQDVNQQELEELFDIFRYNYPQEKVYLHFDRDHYVAGDTAWFRGHLVNAYTHVPDTLSRYLYVELVSPVDSVVQRLRIRNEGFSYPGYIAFPEDIPGGDYTVWAYTNYMRNAGEDYYFRSKISVSHALAAKIETGAVLDFEPEKQALLAKVSFKDIVTGENVRAKELKAGINQADRIFTPNRFNTYSFSFPKMDQYSRPVLEVNNDNIRQYIEIPLFSTGFDVTFHPEGGELIAGTASMVGFKALDAYGISKEVSGQIFDSQGKVVTEFSTLHGGMGTFYFIPVAGEHYYAVCSTSEGESRRFDLPEVSDQAIALHIKQRSGRLYVSAATTPRTKVNTPLYVLIHTRGMVMSCLPIADRNITFDTKSFHSGVSHVLLLDKKHNVLSERLVFIDNDDQAHVSFSTDKTFYGHRDRVRSSVKLTDPEGNPLSGNFSVSVTDDKDLLPYVSQNIYTEMLLSSDLKGHIEEPQRYFDADFPDRDRALDALMLTQGWRRYDVSSLLQKEFPPHEYPLEIGMLISGRVKMYFSSKPSVGTEVYAVGNSTGYFDVQETDKEGRFAFFGFEVPDSASFFVQALNRRGKHNVELILDEETYPPLSYLPTTILPQASQSYIAKADQKWSIENGMRTVHMDAVEVRARKRSDDFMDGGIYAGLADKVIDNNFIKEYNIQNLEQLLTFVPGVSVDNGQIVVRGSHLPPVFLLDDVVQEDFEWETMGMFDVDRVEVVKGPQAAMFGMRGAGGAILIYTKKGGVNTSDMIAFNRQVVNPFGYQLPAAFYAPKYDTPSQKNNPKPDLRTVLYWSPSVLTDDKGEASFEFYTADGGATTYSVVIEGMTDDGRVIHAVEKAERK